MTVMWMLLLFLHFFGRLDRYCYICVPEGPVCAPEGLRLVHVLIMNGGGVARTGQPSHVKSIFADENFIC